MEAVGGLLGVDKPKAMPVIPPSPPPPTIDVAQERQVAGDRLKTRRGAAATRLTAEGGSQGRVGVYKALGGGA